MRTQLSRGSKFGIAVGSIATVALIVGALFIGRTGLRPARAWPFISGAIHELAIGGRLVMPVGATPHAQRLIRVVRTGEETYDRELLEAVAFVPLIGAEGWTPDEAQT